MSDFVDHLVPAEPRGPDTLAKERAQSSLPVKELANHLLDSDGSGFLERQERILRVVEKEKLFSKKNNLNLSRPDRYKVALARAKLVKRLAVRLGWDPEDHKMSVISPHCASFKHSILNMRTGRSI
jgi:acyl-CoA oxidase